MTNIRMINILLIDNNDSFTYNIVNLIRSNFNDVSLTIELYNNVDINNIKNFDKIIFSPGPQVPADYPILFEVLRVYSDKIPILGICLGHQAICEYFGGNINHIGKVVHGEPTEIICDNESLLFFGIKSCVVGRYHSWAAYNLPSQLKIVATTKDGLVMGVEHVSKKIYGVQFHPESYITKNGVEILKNFIYAV